MLISGYKTTGILGEGGMATVFKGVQLSLNREVAIKVLKLSLKNQDEIRSRFQQESFIIARLNHPNIIQVIDQGITDEGCPYFIMPFIKSVNLKSAFETGKITNNRALDIFAQVAKALSYAHKNNVIHCDIKPENILVDFEGNVRVLDFGISKLAKKMSKNTQAEQDYIAGSASYMSPEQQLGISKVSIKSDIYSLGVVMYQFFTNQLPNGGIAPPINLNRNTPELISSLIMKCLERSPSKRPENAEQIVISLLSVLKGEHITNDKRRRAQSDVKKSFQLLDVIKEDRYGAVYLFEEKTSATHYIVKKKPLSHNEVAITKYLSELNHNNIVRQYGTSENARIFISVQEYCRRGSLAERLAQSLDLEEFYRVATGIVEGLCAAHTNHIVHGNIRPSNILFDENDTPKIVDFGSTEHYENSDNNWYTNLNEESGKLADIYALGVLFYEMLMGETPYNKTTYLLKKHKFSQFPRNLQTLIKNMMHKDPAKRISEVKWVKKELEEIYGEVETVVKPISMPMFVQETIQESIVQTRKPFWWIFGFVLVFLILISIQGHFLMTGDLAELFDSILKN